MDKVKKGLAVTWFIFLFFLGIYYLFKSLYIFGGEYEYYRMLKYSEYSYYIKERDYHYKQAMHHYDQAYMACWYCPRIDHQDKARMCLTSAASMVGSTTPSMMFAVSLMTLLTQYGCECMREWHFIKTNLYECQHHFEMYEFYMDLLAKA